MNLSIFNFKTFGNLLLVCLFFLLAEVALRAFYFGPDAVIYYRQYTPRALQRTSFVMPDKDPLIAYRLKADMNGIFKGASFSTDKNGCRSCPLSSVTDNSDIIKVMITGRSISMGAGVKDDEVFGYRLQAMLNRDPHLTVQVINCSVGGYTYGQIMEAFLARNYVKFKPQLIILPVYFGELDKIVNKAPLPLSAYSLNFFQLRSFGADSFFYYGIRHFFKELTAGFLQVDWPSRGHNPLPHKLTNRDVLRVFLKKTAKLPVHVLLVSLPVPEAVPRGQWLSNRSMFADIAADYKNVSYEDLVFPLQDRISASDRIYFSDEHPNARVHNLYAEYLLPLVKKNLVRKIREGQFPVKKDPVYH